MRRARPVAYCLHVLPRNGSYAQSGRAVTVTSASYNGTVPAGGTVMVGFTSTFAGDDTSPAGVWCG
jgi:Cellulose binding domain